MTDDDDKNSEQLVPSKLVPNEEYSSNVAKILREKIAIKTQKEYRQRLKHLYTFWETKEPKYYDVAVRALTEDELNDCTKFWHMNKHDLVYKNLNIEMVLAFLGQKGEKGDGGGVMSHTHIQKYKDAIIYGPTEAGALDDIPTTYFSKIKNFLASFKKVTVQAKKDGKLDEKKADPIPWGLLVLILKWAITEKNIYLWVFGLGETQVRRC